MCHEENYNPGFIFPRINAYTKTKYNTMFLSIHNIGIYFVYTEIYSETDFK